MNMQCWVKGKEPILGAWWLNTYASDVLGLCDSSVRCDWKKINDQEAWAPPQRNVQECLELIKQAAWNWKTEEGAGFFMVAWDHV